MSKYKKMLSRVVTISTYAIIFCVIGNMVMPALIVESVHAQAVSNSASAQADAEKKALDKIQADAKTASYKELGLTKAEISFSEDKSFDLNSINQKLDKYVIYDKNSVASLNANAYRKDGTVKLSKSNTELVISITNKMIAKYNLDLKNLVSKKLLSGASAFSANSNPLSYEMVKPTDGRGYSLKFTSSLSTTLPSSKYSTMQMLYPSCSPSLREVELHGYWWGSQAKLVMNKCLAKSLAYETGSDINKSALIGLGACAIMATMGGIPGFTCLAIVGIITYFYSQYKDRLSYLADNCRGDISHWERKYFGQFPTPYDFNCY